jgi:hypothetical protein
MYDYVEDQTVKEIEGKKSYYEMMDKIKGDEDETK